jgi:hypothetical protein
MSSTPSADSAWFAVADRNLRNNSNLNPSEVVVRFFDICKIVDHHHLNDKSVFSFGTPVSSTNKSHRPYITEILLKVALSTITPSLFSI